MKKKFSMHGNDGGWYAVDENPAGWGKRGNGGGVVRLKDPTVLENKNEDSGGISRGWRVLPGVRQRKNAKKALRQGAGAVEKVRF